MRSLAALFLMLLLPVTAAGEIVTRTVEYNHGNQVLKGYVAYDNTIDGRMPGVLIVHQWTGLTDYERERARMLAEMGYVAFAADIYGDGRNPQAPDESAEWSGRFKNNRDMYRARLMRGLSELRSFKKSDPERVGAIGYCFGGTGALELARSGASIDAVVSFHGGLDTPSPKDAENIEASVLICHGGADPFVPWEQVTAQVERLEKANVDYVLAVYSGAKHSFTEEEASENSTSGTGYDPEADQRSWEAMQDFFDELLRK